MTNKMTPSPRAWLATGLLGVAGFAAPASAASVTDCPLRNAPFSIDSPLIDVLLSPAAKAITDEGMKGALGKAPPRFASTTPPTFAAILTLREAGGMFGTPPAARDTIDQRLRALPVTAADKIARCARYDNDRPALSFAKDKPNVLLFEKFNGFKDGPSVDAAHAALIAMGQRAGWNVIVTDKGGAFTPATLRKVDAVIWNNISGDVLTLAQRKAFRSYVERGGAYVGVHGSAGDPVYFWDWYADTLIGARFAGHPMSPQFQDARVVVDDKSHPAAARLPSEWVMKDEWYSFKTSPRPGSRVIATLDESTYKQIGFSQTNLTMGDHPIAWTRQIGKGRMFYSAIGHMPATYADPRYVKMLEDGIAWAVGPKAAAKARVRSFGVQTHGAPFLPRRK
jgi:type 1 glutamine amidotransferase